MFWSLFIFRGRSTWEPASIVCKDELSDPFYSAGPQAREPMVDTANTEKDREKFQKKMQETGMGRN